MARARRRAKGKKRVGLPSTYAKMGFKKGWAAYRAATGTTTKSKRGRSSAPAARQAAPGKRRKARRSGGLFGKARGLVGRLGARPRVGGIVNTAKNLGLNVGGALASGALVKQLPITNARTRAMAQAIVGVLGSLFLPRRLNWAHEMAEGALIAGAFGVVKSFAPNSPLMSGADLSDEIQFIPQYTDVRPPQAPRVTADIQPAMIGAPVSFGAPVSAMGGYGNTALDCYASYA